MTQFDEDFIDLGIEEDFTEILLDEACLNDSFIDKDNFDGFDSDNYID